MVEAEGVRDPSGELIIPVPFPSPCIETDANQTTMTPNTRRYRIEYRTSLVKLLAGYTHL